MAGQPQVTWLRHCPDEGRKQKNKIHVHYFKLIGGVVTGDLPQENGDNVHSIACWVTCFLYLLHYVLQK
jgi:hypothetical protein